MWLHVAVSLHPTFCVLHLHPWLDLRRLWSLARQSRCRGPQLQLLPRTLHQGRQQPCRSQQVAQVSILRLLSWPNLMASRRCQHDKPMACHHSLQALLSQLGLFASCCSPSQAKSRPAVTPSRRSAVA